MFQDNDIYTLLPLPVDAFDGVDLIEAAAGDAAGGLEAGEEGERIRCGFCTGDHEGCLI